MNFLNCDILDTLYKGDSNTIYIVLLLLQYNKIGHCLYYRSCNFKKMSFFINAILEINAPRVILNPDGPFLKQHWRCLVVQPFRFLGMRTYKVPFPQKAYMCLFQMSQQVSFHLRPLSFPLARHVQEHRSADFQGYFSFVYHDYQSCLPLVKIVEHAFVLQCHYMKKSRPYTRLINFSKPLNDFTAFLLKPPQLVRPLSTMTHP